MQSATGRNMIACALVALTLAACGDRDPELMNINRSQRTPDEFAILPNKPIQQPETYAALPTPTPGGGNLVDPTPEADAVAALGGDPRRVARNGGPLVGDPGLLNHSLRYGRRDAIRAELAAADLEYRRKNDGRLLERLFNLTIYYKAYEPYAPDQHAELERWRRAGARTPAAPPQVE